MFEKEILTKKQLVKIIMPKIRDMLLATLALLLLAIAFFSLYQLYLPILNEDFSDIYNETGMLIMTFGGNFLKWIAIFCILAIIEVWISCFYTVICLYRNKFYLIVAPLKAKSKKKNAMAKGITPNIVLILINMVLLKPLMVTFFIPLANTIKWSPKWLTK